MSVAVDAPGQAVVRPRPATWVYHQGAFVEFDRATLPLTTQAFNYGTGVFEGIRAHTVPGGGGLAIFRAHDHYERFLRSCRFLRIEPGSTVEQLVGITVELLRRNAIATDCYIRPIAYKTALRPGTPPGVGLGGVGDSWSIVVSTMGAYHPSDGIRCAISSWRRSPRTAIPPQVKIAGAYVNNALAVDEARSAGYDDAILLDDRGCVAEASTANVFAVVGGRLLTPAAGSDVLPGVTRDTVLALSAERGLDAAERDLSAADLLLADEVFLTGTGVGVTPVVHVAGRAIGGGVAGPVASALARRYGVVVRGGDPARGDWITPVELD